MTKIQIDQSRVVVKTSVVKAPIVSDNLIPDNAKFTPLYALVRDSTGRPKIDDGNLMPDWAKKELLTEKERQHLAVDRYTFNPFF